jgi:hypothetical protein
MGYRARLGKVKKSEKEYWQNKSYDEVDEEIGSENAVYFPPFHTQIYELGKYFNFTQGKTPFYSFDVEEETECEFFIMSKQELKELIQDCHEIIYQYFERMAQGLKYEDTPQEHVEDKARSWGNQFINPYYLDEEKTDGEITKSWSYEYSIFNLVYIYRTFDWENDYLIYSAW